MLHWPPFHKYTCKGLSCNDPWCLAVKTATICAWALHYTIDYYEDGEPYAKLHGIWQVCYETHLQCDCRKCEHITSSSECVQTEPCPNGVVPNTGFCYWRQPSVISSDPSDVIAAANGNGLTGVTGACNCCHPKSCIEPLEFNPDTCQCACKQLYCKISQVFNEATCMCECDNIQLCDSLHIWNPDTCECDCKSTCLPPKTAQDLVTCKCECPPIVCTDPPRTVLNDNTCECECPPTHCTDPLILNPTTCECECPDCPPGSTLDSDTCDCIGVCNQQQYHGSDYCEMVHCIEDPSRMCALTAGAICECPPGESSRSRREITDPGECNNTACPDNNSLRCKFYHYHNPSTGQEGCQCDDIDTATNTDEDCCIEKPSAPLGVDCSIYNAHGSDDCNSVSNREACEWKCDCSEIDDHEACIRSTCKDFPTVSCEYSQVTGCSCPRCCRDHPNKSAVFDCSTLDSFGSERCNQVLGGNTCQWTCPCNEINSQDACDMSTCIDDPNRRCQFDTAVGACFCT
ncbi:balbiani ring protein 3-like [Dysidea avara]|uniref:balbiani ring protein 3-like n=1 Tax=Dysidea avara TaxID=196820 RepID=UPI00332A70F5